MNEAERCPQCGGRLTAGSVEGLCPRCLLTAALRPPAETVPESPPESGCRIGAQIGAYRIVRLLGEGGMGSVYLAQRADRAFQKNVAIKILRPDAASPNIVLRFHREREILARLDHPNIARLLDAGLTEDGRPYYVMEYVDGRRITQYADEARLSVRERLSLFQQVCDAVEYAHQHNVVHRDLKPGNVLVSDEGQVKLLDFGIAGLLEQDPGLPALTRSGIWPMTPEYASPEQVRGEVAGRASDVYSLGMILFELLTGHRPYRLRSRIFHEILRVVCEEPPTRPSAAITQPIETTTAEGRPDTLPAEMAGRARRISLSDLKRELSGDLDNILLKALRKQPQDRYASAFLLRADIERRLKGEAVWARRDSSWGQIARRLSRYRVALVVLAAGAAAVATGAVRLRWSALWWAGGAAALAGLWRAATDRTIGQRIGGTWLLSSRLGSALGWGTVIGALVLLSRGRQWPFFLIGIGFSLVAAVYAGAWFRRERWSGPLLLDLDTSHREKWAQIGGYCCLLDGIVRLATQILLPTDLPTDRAWTWAFSIAAAVVLLTRGRNEIRRDGFLKQGRLIRWSRIASWTWEFAEESLLSLRPPNVLVLRLHRRIQFMPPVKIGLPEGHKDEVEAILSRQMGEWPGQGG